MPNGSSSAKEKDTMEVRLHRKYEFSVGTKTILWPLKQNMIKVAYVTNKSLNTWSTIGRFQAIHLRKFMINQFLHDAMSIASVVVNEKRRMVGLMNVSVSISKYCQK
jgi:hypothetical protein